MKKKVVSKYSWIYKGVALDPVSMTVPDQSLSVEEILRRFTSGTLSEGEVTRDHSYGSDILPHEDFDNLALEYDPDFDLVDAYELAQQKDDLFLQVQKQKMVKKKPSHSAGSLEPEGSSPAAPKVKQGRTERQEDLEGHSEDA